MDPVRTHEWLAGVALGSQTRPRLSTLLRWFLIGVACWAAVGALITIIALERFSLPAPTGPYAVGTTILDFTDSARHETHSPDPNAKRTLVAQVWYPAAASKNSFARYQRWSETTFATMYTPLLHTHSRVDAPLIGTALPVLIFGPRWGGERTQNTDLAEELASQGYVVVAVDHPYNASRVKPADGSVIKGVEAIEGPAGPSSSSAQQIAFWNATLNEWAADDSFVLNQLAAMNADAGSRFHQALDMEHVGAFGHSFGGAAAFRLLGLDPRVKSAVNLDGWTFGALASRTTQPVMVLFEQSGADREQALLSLPQPGNTVDQLDRADNAAVEASLHRFGGYRLYVNGTQHMDFTDQPLLPPLRRLEFTGPIAPMRVQEILRITVVAFFNQTLRQKSSALFNDPRSTMDDVRIERFADPTVNHLPSQ